MHIPRKPGEHVEVDWCGQTAFIVNRDTGEIIPVYVFVAALSYSQYAYVEAFLSQDLECWISAHVNMYRFFGGVTRILFKTELYNIHIAAISRNNAGKFATLSFFPLSVYSRL